MSKDLELPVEDLLEIQRLLDRASLNGGNADLPHSTLSLQPRSTFQQMKITSPLKGTQFP